MSCYKKHRHEKEVERYHERGPRRKMQYSTEKAIDNPMKDPPEKSEKDRIDVYVTDLTGELRCVRILTVSEPSIEIHVLFYLCQGSPTSLAGEKGADGLPDMWQDVPRHFESKSAREGGHTATHICDLL